MRLPAVATATTAWIPRLASPRFHHHPREAELATYGPLYHLLLTADAQPPDLLQPYCNQASTRWYTMDKATLPARRRPPKQALFPDTVGRASMYASKLVAGAGVTVLKPARRLFVFPAKSLEITSF